MLELSYTSCGCNRTPHSVDWGRNNQICYASANAVSICRPYDPAKVTETLIGHTDRVNCVKWIRKTQNGDETECVSCSTDKSIILWRKDENGKFVLRSRLSGHHTGSVTVVDAIYVTNEQGQTRTLLASASSDSKVNVWQRDSNEDEFKCIQTLSLGNGFALDVAWGFLPGSNVPILGYGGDDQKIHLLVEQNSQFVEVLKLPGHEDWVRCLEFSSHGGDLLLATCAQDCYIRLWRISSRSSADIVQQDITEISLDADLCMKETTFMCANNEQTCHFAVSLDSVLSGHENWIYGLQWKPAVDKVSPLSLVSSSMDKTVIIWEPDHDSGVWMEKVRVGEVGGSLPGFYGAVFSPDGSAILAHGYHGSFHLWRQQVENPCAWLPSVMFGGHFAPVQDIAWDPEGGEFLLSVSTDQTTRVHAVWKNNQGQLSWHELARPQVHGYDLTCLAMINRYSFASGADEKVVRVFDATQNFMENLARVTKLDVSKDLETKRSSAPQGASVPALGLSNKAVYEGDGKKVEEEEDQAMLTGKTQYPEVYFSPLSLEAPPTEVDLLQNTLWPETQKLYGHGNEIFAAACHPKGTVLATACKAQKADHASIILWDTATWRQVCQLAGHSLTVTQLVFSHCGDYLLSVSRDRTWALYRQQQLRDQASNTLGYERVAYSDKKTSVHSRIIWGAAWSHDDKYFVTVSRDKKAVVWQLNSPEAEAEASPVSCLGSCRPTCTPLDLPDSVTAVDFAPVSQNGEYLLAFGLDNGHMLLYTWNCEAKAWTKLAHADQSVSHHQCVKRIRFRPVVGEVGRSSSSGAAGQGSLSLQLASCGADHAVRVYTVRWNCTASSS